MGGIRMMMQCRRSLRPPPPLASSVDYATSVCWSTYYFRQRPFQQQPTTSIATLTTSTSCPVVGQRNISAIIGPPTIVHQKQNHHQQQQLNNHHHPLLLTPTHTTQQLQLQPFKLVAVPTTHQQQQQQRRSFAVSTKSRNNNNSRNNKKKVDENLPLLNEHLIAELFNKKKRDNVTADTLEVRLIVDHGWNKKKNGDNDEEEEEEEEEESTPTTQITTLAQAITISHKHALDLMEVTIQQTPPVIKAVDFDKWSYEKKKKEKAAQSKKKREGGGAISDRPLKEFKFRAGIADHDLERKATNMLKYLEKGHAIRVTLTARQRSLNADAEAIRTTLDRVKELVGDKAVEVRGMKANDRKSYGSLLMHPSKNASTAEDTSGDVDCSDEEEDSEYDFAEESNNDSCAEESDDESDIATAKRWRGIVVYPPLTKTKCKTEDLHMMRVDEPVERGGKSGYHAMCRLKGCGKRAQGEKRDFFCKEHFHEFDKLQTRNNKKKVYPPPAFTEWKAEDSRMMKVGEPVEYGGDDGYRVLCRLKGCGKQSRGEKRDFFCTEHFNEFDKLQTRNNKKEVYPPLVLTKCKTEDLHLMRVGEPVERGGKNGSQAICRLKGCGKQGRGKASD